MISGRMTRRTSSGTPLKPIRSMVSNSWRRKKHDKRRSSAASDRIEISGRAGEGRGRDPREGSDAEGQEGTDPARASRDRIPRILGVAVMVGFVIGFVAGTFFGLFNACLLIIAGREDDEWIN